MSYFGIVYDVCESTTRLLLPMNIRTLKYIQQLKASFIFKILAILTSFISIPIMIDYLGTTKYGVWSTLLSILAWVLMFDLGLGNGLKNRISESIAKEDTSAVKEYISSAYFAVGLIAILIGAIFLFISSYVPWASVFNTEVISEQKLGVVVDLTMVFILVNFFLSLINQVLKAVQKTEFTVFNQFLANVLSLISICYLYYFTDSSLEYLAFFYGLSIFISNLVFSLWFYNHNSSFMPNFSFVSYRRLKDTLALGGRFFIIQIAVIVLFTTDRFIITQLLGPDYVTPYDVVFKLFSIITIIHGIIMAPLWTSYSDAYHRGDYPWMRSMMMKQLQICLLLLFGVLSLSLISPYIIDIWIGELPFLDRNLILSLAIFTLVLTWNNVFAIFLNGINETRLQMKTSIVASIINIPLSVFFVKFFDMGIEGVVLGTVLALGIFGLLGPYESCKLLYKGKMKPTNC
jgi:O-antigen/teichoic acid export membrane protein